MDNSARLPFRRGFTAAGAPSTSSTVSSAILIANPTGGSQISTLPTTLGLLNQANQFRPDLASIDNRFDAVDSLSDTLASLPSTSLALVGSDRRLILRAVQASAQFQIGGNATSASPAFIARGFALDASPAGTLQVGLFGFTDNGNTSSGGVGKVPDFAYAPGTWVSQYDWYYVVEEGPALVTAGAPINLGQAFMWDGTGRAIPFVSAATNHCAGVITAIVSGATTATTGTVMLASINPGIRIG